MQLTKKHKLILTGAAILAASYVIHYVAMSAINITSNVRPVAQPPKGNPFLTTRSIIPAPAPRPVSVAPPAPAPPPAAPATVAAPPAPASAGPNTTPQAPVIPAPPSPGPVANGAQASPSQPENLLLQRVSALSGIWVGNAALGGGRGMCRLRFEFHDDHQEQNHYQGFFQLWCNAVNQDRIDPEAATFTGTTDNDGVTFKAATLIGTDSHGCAPATFTIIPFGAGQIVGKWSEAHCPGGHMIMQRGR